MKKAIYILYTICVLMVVSFFVYVCVDSRNEVFSARKQSECQYLSAYKKTKVYENARLIGFGEYKKAVEFDGGTLRILDFEIEFF